MPTSTYLSLTYVTPFDPAYVDLWGTPVNNFLIGLDLDAGVKQINQDFNDKVLSKPIFKDYGETVTTPSSASNVLVLDCALSNHFAVTLTENVTTLTLSNPSPTGNKCAIVFEITQDSTARTITWPASVKWVDGVAPTLSSASGAIDEIVLTTRNAGSTWLGTVRGQAFA